MLREWIRKHKQQLINRTQLNIITYYFPLQLPSNLPKFLTLTFFSMPFLLTSSTSLFFSISLLLPYLSQQT